MQTDFGLCPSCWKDTPFIVGLTCDACGTPLPGKGDGYRIECDDCMRNPPPWSNGRAALVYKGQARRLMLGLKHGDRTDIARPAAQWMARAAQPILQGDMVIAPVPLHWTRLFKRRYNQSALLAHGIGRITGLPVCADLLQRRKRTPMLDGLTAQDRKDTLSGAIRLHPRRVRSIKGRSVLLVDDVMTSGATLSACTRLCLDAGARDVRVVVLARVTKD